jgi:hypothetical protein
MSTKESAMTTARLASLTTVGRRPQVEHLPTAEKSLPGALEDLVARLALSALDPATMVETWRRLTKAIFDPYRPELHYMRGPGPKWREKHAQRNRRST